MQEVTETLDFYARFTALLDSKISPLGIKIDDLSSKVEILTTHNAVNAAQMATHEARITVLESWKNTLPDKEEAKKEKDATKRAAQINLTWQNVGGGIGVVTFLLWLAQHMRFTW